MNFQIHRHRSIVAALALVAMLLRAMIPQGFMPGAIGDGTPFVVCHGGPLKALLDRHGDAARTDSQNSGKHCPFALAVASALPTAPLIAPIVVPLADEFFVPLVLSQAAAFGPPRIHANRGPPALS